MTDPGSARPYGVLGATGQQGGAVVDALLASGVPVRAIVRDTSSDGSAALAARGVEVMSGDLDDPTTLAGPFDGLAALFMMFTFTDSSGTDGEVRRGTAVADAAAAAGVPSVVYSSVGGAERRTGIPHFESKRRIEEHLESLRGSMASVFVRPAYFMDNLAQQLEQYRDGGGEGEFVFAMPMPGDVRLQLIAVRDIGRVAAAALIDPGVLGSPALEIAGDELTGEQIAAAVGRHLDRPARYEAQSVDALDPDLQAMFRWFVDTPAYEADFARTRAVDPDVLDLAGWLDTRRDRARSSTR